MFPTYEIFDITFASYGTLILIGILAGFAVSVALTKKHSPELTDDVIYAFLLSGIGVAVGGKLLFFIVSLREIIEILKSDLPFMLRIKLIMQGGFVFYGSLIGVGLAIYIYSRAFKVKAERLLYFLVPSIPLIHSIGRIGCLAAGCCYGVACPDFGYELNRSPIAPHGIRLFPTQLLESIYCFLIFILILFLFKKITNGYHLLAVYIFAYAPFRFGIEFFRGDAARGIWGIFSTSQIISLVLIVITIIYLSKHKKRAADH